MATSAIALDLGSESTTAMFFSEGSNSLIEIDLQYPAYAQAKRPLFMMTDGTRSKGLRTRFFAQTFGDEWQHNGSLQWDMPKEPFIVDPTYEAKTTRNDVVDRGPASKGPISYFLEVSHQNKNSEWLPNAKVVFLAEPTRVRRFESVTQGVGLDLDPQQIIRLQLSQILNQFALQNPLVRRRRSNSGSDWGGTSIVLSVPNSYSPTNSTAIKKFVEQDCPHANVSCISESDALVLYCCSQFKVARREALGVDANPLSQMTILTLDIGKGTTDATLAVVGPKNNRLSITPKARTGKFTGGAKLTYSLVKFLEQLAIHTLRGYAWMNDPSRFHTRLDNVRQARPGLPIHFSQLEEFCNELKTKWSSQWQKKQSPVLLEPPNLRLAEAVARGMVHGWSGEQEIEFDVNVNWARPEPPADVEAPEMQTPLEWEVAVRSLTRVLSALPTVFLHCRQPNRESDVALRNLGLEPATVRRLWTSLADSVSTYVTENVDEVFQELYLEFQYGLNSSISMPVDSIDAVQGLASTGHYRNSSIRPSQFRIMVAGKGSLFRPIRDRLHELARHAGVQVSIGDSPAKPKSNWLAWMFGKPEPHVGPIDLMRSTRNGAPVMRMLTGEECKRACVEGTIHCYMNDVSAIEPYLSGLLVIEPTNSPIQVVDMAALNREKKWDSVDLGSGDVEVASRILYFPSMLKGFEYVRAIDEGESPSENDPTVIPTRILRTKRVRLTWIDGAFSILRDERGTWVEVPPPTLTPTAETDVPELLAPLLWPALMPKP